jgi:hypothetical protein
LAAALSAPLTTADDALTAAMWTVLTDAAAPLSAAAELTAAAAAVAGSTAYLSGGLQAG